MLLDVSRLSREALWAPSDTSAPVNLAVTVGEMRATVDLWAGTGLVKANPSFGFAAARNNTLAANWDDPYRFVWFVAGWGPEQDRYIANAVRKLRALLRTGYDTLQLRLGGSHLFDSKVESAEADGTFLWGDFPWGGATTVRVGDLAIPCAVSALKEVEDDAAAKAIGGHIGATMLKARDPHEFA